MRILLATDQPFWQRRGGAHQRIDSLWAAICGLSRPMDDDADSLIYFLGDPNDVESANFPRQLGQIHAVRSQRSAWSKIWRAWRSSWSWRQSGAELEARDTTNVDAASSVQELTLSDYCWTWVAQDWNKTLQAFEPDVVILEYVTMTYLQKLALPEARRRIVWAVDTHDCLSERAAQFRKAGQAHWLNITESEEIAALESVDLVIAIQDLERKWFEQRLTKPQVLTVEHGPKELAVASPRTASERGASLAESVAGQERAAPLRIGFLASNNFPNRHGILNWLDSVAFNLSSMSVELLVGGTIAGEIYDFLSKDGRVSAFRSQVRALGPVSDLAEFYRSIDVSLCPIEVGTGLKIKLVESLAFGVPVLASPQAASETLTAERGVVVCRTPTEWLDHLHRMIEDRDYLRNLQAAAYRYAECACAPSIVYGDLMQCLHTLVAAKAIANEAEQP
ncbi:MAG: glycosyltransferase [Planctomycetaceae bacterium]|nr:glycosyltransferase [Planctomycetaceae bacterium]